MTEGRRELLPAILLGWAFAAAVLTLTCWPAIVQARYPDPDDILRLLEVRDLVNGQSWWDVNQHRLASGLMHWSRLVDLPLAAVIWPLRGMVGEALAERVAMVVVPLVTLLAVMALAALVTRRLTGDADGGERARASLLVAPLSVPLIYQMRPMRIDHHGWQVALAMAALLAFLSPRKGDWRDARSGALGGLALGALLTISLEGLPVAAALLGLVALGWALDPARRRQMAAATGGAFGAALALHVATRGPHVLTPACDAMSPVWLAVLGVAAAGTAILALIPVPIRPEPVEGRDPHATPTVWRTGDRVSPNGWGGVAARLAGLAIVAAACAGALLLIDPRCTAGPFQMLDPLVRQLWYDKVSEGLPIGQQLPIWAAMTVGLPIVGLVGCALGWREATGERRAAWATMTGALAAAFALSLMVNRSGATANAFAVPGGAVVLTALLTRARAVRGVVARTLATAGALLAAAPGLAAVPLLGLPEDEIAAAGQARLAGGPPPCQRAEDARALAALPRATLFAPIDIAPEIIAATDHHAITSGHHRNAAAMLDVLRAFTGTPDQARAIVTRYRADYVVGCPGLNETELYRTQAPVGFWARLEAGERFGWLRPVAVPGSPVRAWRVLPLREGRRSL